MAKSYEELKEELREQRLNSNKVNINNIPNINHKKQDNEEVVFDNYGMDEKFQKLKRILSKIEPRLYKFIFKETHDASIDARNGLNEIRKLCVEIRADILKQRQDNKNDY